MSERADFVKKIEDELDKPVAERNQDKLAFWRTELEKIPVSAGKNVICIHSSFSPCFCCLFL